MVQAAGHPPSKGEALLQTPVTTKKCLGFTNVAVIVTTASLSFTPEEPFVLVTVMGIEPRALSMLGKHYTTELHP
jgi:hypothetical protein